MPVDQLAEGARNRKAVLAFVEEMAASGAPMLTNGEIAKHLNLTLGMVKWAIRTLNNEGVIRREMRGSHRRLVICSAGNETGWSRQTKPVWPATSKASVRDRRRGQLLDLIKRCAQAGEVLPTNTGIAEELVCAADTIRRDLHCLVRSRVISVEMAGPKRRIAIVKTGEVTPWSVGGCGIGRAARRVDPPPPCPAEVEVEAPPLATLLPCARVGCSGTAEIGKAYCAGHEAAEVLEWPVGALDLTQEDLAA